MKHRAAYGVAGAVRSGRCKAASPSSSCPERLRGTHRGRCVVSGGDELRTAVDAEGAALPPRHGVLGAVALRGRQSRVHHTAALRAVAHRRVPPPVVLVLAYPCWTSRGSDAGRYQILEKPTAAKVVRARTRDGLCATCVPTQPNCAGLVGSAAAKLTHSPA
jgi:hypothetical protein